MTNEEIRSIFCKYTDRSACYECMVRMTQNSNLFIYEIFKRVRQTQAT